MNRHNRTVKINFQSGDMKIYKNIKEFVSGIYYFFMVQVSDNNTLNPICIDRRLIDNVQVRYKNYWKSVSLKKRNFTKH